MDWTEENIIKLIGLYETYPVLWDPQHKFHKLNNKKNDAWMEISDAMNVSVADVKKKMNSVLASFRRERQKVANTASGMGISELYNGTWFAFRHLLFLSGKYQPKPTTSTLGSEEMIRSPIQESQDHIDINETIVIKETVLKAIDAPRTSTIQFKKKTSAPNESRKRKMVDPLVSEAVATLRDVKQRITTAKDSFDKYGEYIAGELRQLDAYSAAYVQKMLGDIIFNAKLGYYKPRNSFQNAPIHSTDYSIILSPDASTPSTSTTPLPPNHPPQVQSTNDESVFDIGPIS